MNRVTFEDMLNTLDDFLDEYPSSEVIPAIRQTLKAVEKWQKEASRIREELATGNPDPFRIVYDQGKLISAIRDFDPGKED